MSRTTPENLGELLTIFVGEALHESNVRRRKKREVETTDGAVVRFGSNKHVKDLEKRIAGLVKWRDKEKKGSEARANYARIISRLKRELASAKADIKKSK